MSATEHGDIVARLAVVESQIQDLKGDVHRMEQHVGKLYNRLDSQNRWLMGLLGAALLNLAVLLFRG